MGFRAVRVVVLMMVTMLTIAACGGGGGGGSTPDPTPTPVQTPDPAPTPDPTPSPTPTPDPTPSPTPTPTLIPTPSPTPTVVPTPSPSPTPTIIPTPSPSPTPTPTPSPTPTPTPSPTPDTVPDDFSFDASDDAPRSEWVESEPITVTGIDSPAAVTIVGGEYAIGDGDFSDGAGLPEPDTLEEGQTVTVRVFSSADFDTDTSAVLTIGGVDGTFTVTTEILDNEPNAFAPADPQTEVPVDTTFTFDAFDVAGVSDDAAISISITGDGRYSVAGGDFTSDESTVMLGDSVVVEVDAASEFAGETSATLTIGTLPGEFIVVAEVEDILPEEFDLGEEVVVTAPSAYGESEIITVSGINSAADISLSAGEYRIVDETEFGDTQPTTVTEGQQVQVRLQGGTADGETTNATLTIGDIDGGGDVEDSVFTVRTSDVSAPTASVVFPTASTLSYGSNVTLRGTASDDFGVVERIQVIVSDGINEIDNQVIDADVGDDFQTSWSVRVNLQDDTVNQISVLATDAAGNVQGEATQLSVTQSTTSTSFPEGNDDVEIGNFNARGMAWDQETDRLFIPLTDQILAVDIDTGVRSVFIDDDPAFESFGMVQVLPDQDLLLFSDRNAGVIYKASLETAAFEVLSDEDTPGSDTDIVFPQGLKLHSNGQIYVSDAGGDSLYSVNLDSGARTLVSDDTRPVGGANPFDLPRGLMLDETNNRAIVADATNGQLIDVDLDTGVREVFVDNDELSAPFDLVLDLDESRIIVVDSDLRAIFSADLSSAELTELSSSTVPSGGANDLEEPWGIVVDVGNNIAFVFTVEGLFIPNAGIKVVDLTTGERVILTNSVTFVL